MINTANYQPVPLLSDRVILVTGASSGIGRVVAKSYAEHGATVILLARNVKKLESLYDEIIENAWPTPAIYPLNLANATPKDYEDLKDNIEAQFGVLDGILHNAAFLGTLTPFEHIAIPEWYQVLQVNLNSAFLLTQAALPLLKRSKDASLIFTTANVGQKAKAYWSAYCVSKFGIEGLMQLLAEEFENNTAIRVNCIDPGEVRTPLRSQAYPAEDISLLKEPKDLLPTYLYLMGPDSHGVTGLRYKA